MLMNTIIRLSVVALSTLLAATSCNNAGTENKGAAADSTATTGAPHMSISKVGTSPEFADASLAIKSASAVRIGKDSAKVTLEFDVKNYQLTAQTSDAAGKGCNNSDKGQHIHFIMDNQPYKALYEPKNEVTLANGTEHYLMCFLSRSYHESLKNKGAAVVLHFKIDENGKYQKLEDPKTPMVFYSRPKGDYVGKDMEKVLLDFYVWNTSLSAEGYRVMAHITNPDNNVDTTATITTWESYYINNLGAGKSKIALTLLDKDGNKPEGPNTTVTREFNLAASEPMKP